MKQRTTGFVDDIVFPGGKTKAFTTSYDDGTIHDRRLVEILNKYGIHGTFNLNSGFFGLDRSPKPDSFMKVDISVIDESEVPALYRGHEVAGHGLTHASPTGVGSPTFLYETIVDKGNLERATGKMVRGYAYPFGIYDDQVKEMLRLSGYHYARVVETTGKFDIPKDFFEWKGTAHHNDEKLMELAKDFCDNSPKRGFGFMKKIFYVWGHSYEFAFDDSWYKIENLCKYMQENGEDVWFATNIEIVDYVNAFRSLEYAAEGEMIYNPTAIPVSFRRGFQDVYTVNPGETIKL